MGNLHLGLAARLQHLNLSLQGFREEPCGGEGPLRQIFFDRSNRSSMTHMCSTMKKGTECYIAIDSCEHC